MLPKQHDRDEKLDITRILRHDVYFLFTCHPIRTADDAKDLIPGNEPSILADVSATMRTQDSQLWEVGDWPVSRDFLPQAKRLFDRSRTKVHMLTRLGLDFANRGSWEDTASDTILMLKLGHEASKHANDLDMVPVYVEDLHVLRFPSDVTVGVLRLRYGIDTKWLLPRASNVILECNHYLGHPLIHKNDSLRWVSKTSKNAPRLMGLVRTLLEPVGYEPTGMAFQRMFVFTAFSTDAPRIDISEFDLLLARLARKHTANYLPGMDYVRVFGLLKNIRFSAMSEGAALVVSTATGSDFSAGYLDNPVPRAYLPIAVASIHEHALLRRMEGAIVRMPTEEGKPRLALLERLRRELQQFKLGFRLRTISGIAMHNEFNSHLRTALGLDGAVNRLTEDVQVAENQLLTDLHHRDERKRQWLTAIGSAIAAFTITHELFDIAIKLKWDGDIAVGVARFINDKSNLLRYEHMVMLRDVDEGWAVVVSVVVGFCAGFLTWLKKWTFPKY